MNRIVLLSLMPRSHPGGVARWVNDFFEAFPDREIVHYCVDDLFSRFGQRNISEWDAAFILSQWLQQKRMINPDTDEFIVDGFWGLGLPPGPNVTSVAHGTWARRVKSDLDKGIPPEFPIHMRIQDTYWKNLIQGGGSIVSVSEFCEDDLRSAWNIPSVTINNAIDGKKFSPRPKIYRERQLIIHGVTSKVKAADHIEYLTKRMPDVDIWLLDEAAQRLNMPKHEALAQADLVVIPSHYEGNSYFTLEALSVGVPIVCYDVGMPWWAYRNGWCDRAGRIIDYGDFGLENFRSAVVEVLARPRGDMDPQGLASLFTPERFRDEWKLYLDTKWR